MATIGYITSGKVGIHSFTHNELNELSKEHKIILCLTQLNKGPFMPKVEWNTIVPSKKKLFLSVVKFVIIYPRLFLNLYRIAKKSNVIPYLLIAIHFYSKFKSLEVTNLHCQMGDKKLYIGYFLKKITGLPLSATIHAHELYQKESYNEPSKIIKLFNSCDKIITISDFNKNILISKFLLPPDKIEVMRLFPELNRINKILGKAKVLIVANWVEKKGYRTLFEAVKNIKRNDFIITVVGGNVYSENSIDLKNLIKDMNLQDKVILLGRFGGVQLDVIFSACDIFCLPSITEYYPDGNPAEREGIPVSLMEAMAWGKPVITTRHAGIPELVEEILIEERNVQQLISALNYLLDNRDKWHEMGKRNQQIIEQRYHPRNVAQLSSIFSNLNKN